MKKNFVCNIVFDEKNTVQAKQCDLNYFPTHHAVPDCPQGFCRPYKNATEKEFRSNEEMLAKVEAYFQSKDKSFNEKRIKIRRELG
ncbi:hypothetical protein TNCV_284171 [Trichonephila clavipes]|uniref:Uncharacterized protein n=1 Tax=Trichonephila clavipes TaxID=2585209 RepID=A0A8X6SEV1_TRICX|nr:hypothetical protein TNCV_284171 [Trichonephila clavipes]